MKVPGSTLGHHADLATGGIAILRLIIRGHDLHLLGRIDAGDADDGAVATGTDGGSAVKEHRRILRASTVDLEWIAAANREIKVAERRTGAHSGDQRAHVERIAPVELLIADLLARNC